MYKELYEETKKSFQDLANKYFGGIRYEYKVGVYYDIINEIMGVDNISEFLISNDLLDEVVEYIYDIWLDMDTPCKTSVLVDTAIGIINGEDDFHKGVNELLNMNDNEFVDSIIF